jgi:hypothetical protein
MALASIAVPPDAKRDARALELVDQVGSWSRFVLKQPYGSFPSGTVFRRAPSSKGDGTTYLVNAVACSCPDYQENGAICKHVRAVVLWEQHQVSQQPMPTSAPRKSYADLFPACKGGCGDVADTRDGYCDRCASEREWQARQAARREFVAVAPFTLNPLAE